MATLAETQKGRSTSISNAERIREEATTIIEATSPCRRRFFFRRARRGHDVFDEERSSFVRLFDILAVRRFVDGFWLAASFLKNFRKVR